MSSAHNAGVDNPLDNDFQNRVEAVLEEWKVPGIAIAVIDRKCDKTWHQGYGISDLESKKRVTPHTNFLAGSTSKAFLAAALALHIRESQGTRHPLSWQTPVCQLIRDDFVLTDSWATEHLTLEDILSHRSGLPSHDLSIREINTAPEHRHKPSEGAKQAVRNLRNLPFSTEPRTTFRYNNLLFITASCALEARTGKWLGHILREQIWAPLSMNGTYFSREDAAASEANPLAKGYRWDTFTQEYVHVPWMSLNSTSGAGSVISNVLDYSKWAKAILAKDNPLTKTEWEEVTTPRTIVPDGPPWTGARTYALGWRGGVYKGRRVLSHAGGMDAFASLFILFPEDDFAVVAMGNTAGSAAAVSDILLWGLIDDHFGIPTAERTDWAKRNRDGLDNFVSETKNARRNFFPNLSEPIMPTTLPLEAYIGTYHDPGYGTLKIELTDGPPSPILSTFLDANQTASRGLPTTLPQRSALDATSHPDITARQSTQTKDVKKSWLRAHRGELATPEHLTFQHMSAEFFLAWGEWDADYGAWAPNVYPVEFRIGPNGQVTSVGVGYENLPDKIWFHRQEK